MRSRVGCGTRIIAAVIGLICVAGWFFIPSWGLKMISNANSEPEQRYDHMSDPTGLGPAFPDYWVNEDYWVAEGCPVPKSIKEKAEKVLAKLDADNIAKVAIVCMPFDGFVQPGAWTSAFVDYYQIGLADGPRSNNGAAWLILYDNNRVEIHYGLGIGLPAITAGELGPIMRSAESVYQEGGLEAVVMDITTNFDRVARNSYEPYEPRKPEYGGPIDNSGGANTRTYVVIFLVVVWIFTLAVIFSEPFLALGVVLGSATALSWMLWPAHIVMALLEAAANSSGGSSGSGSSGRRFGSRSSGRSRGGGGRSFRNR